MLAERGDTIPVKQQIITMTSFLCLEKTEYGSVDEMLVPFLVIGSDAVRSVSVIAFSISSIAVCVLFIPLLLLMIFSRDILFNRII